MDSDTPFFRGFNRVDGVVLCNCIFGAYQQFPNTTSAAISAIEPIEEEFFLPETASTPAVCVVGTEHYFFIVVAGTNTTVQLILDVLLNVQISYPGLAGQANAYFGGVGFTYWTWLQSEPLKHVGNRKVVITGHSLGAAAALVIGNFFRTNYPNEFVAQTFGCPRTGNLTFASYITNNVFRYEDRLDPVVAVPPPVWAAIGSQFPIPGPPPFSFYVQPGQAVTMEYNGTATPGSDPLNLLQTAAAVFNVQFGPHDLNEYARRLALGITPEDVTPPVPGYENPQVVLPNYNSAFVPVRSQMASTPITKVTYFYNYFGDGITESWYSDQNYDQLIGTATTVGLIQSYLKERMAVAMDNLKFIYCRISNLAAKRQVDFVVPSDDNIVTSGAWANSVYNASDPSDALLVRMKLPAGPSGRLFLHAFPSRAADGINFIPNNVPGYKNAMDKFTDFLIGQPHLLHLFTTATTLANRKQISAITPALSGRGATITPANTDTLVPGNLVTIGGTGIKMIGIKGRKVVLSTSTGPYTFNIGGAIPAGSYTPGTGYYYLLNQTAATPTYAKVERVGEHRTGRPFGVPAGRRSNVIPLRQ